MDLIGEFGHTESILGQLLHCSYIVFPAVGIELESVTGWGCCIHAVIHFLRGVLITSITPREHTDFQDDSTVVNQALPQHNGL